MVNKHTKIIKALENNYGTENVYSALAQSSLTGLVNYALDPTLPKQHRRKELIIKVLTRAVELVYGKRIESS